MNTVKRWLAGILSFAMVFTSAGFSSVGTIASFAASNAFVVTTDDGTKNYASNDFATALQETVDTYSYKDQVNKVNEGKAAVITLNEDAVLDDTTSVNIPLIIDLNGHKLNDYKKLTKGNDTCINITYNDKAYPTKITFAFHNPKTVYNWVYTPGKNPAWYVKSISKICANCGLKVSDPNVAISRTIYNADKNRYEFYDTAGDDILSTHTSEVDVDGWYMTVDPYIVAVNGVNQHANNLPIVKAALTKISTGETKLVDVAVTAASADEINAAIKTGLYNSSKIGEYGIEKGNEAATCESGGAIVYKAVVTDPDGNVLNTSYLRDTQATEKLDHVKGAIVGLEFAVKSDTEYKTAVAAKKAGQAVEGFIEVTGSKNAYYYWYWKPVEIKGDTKVGSVQQTFADDELTGLKALKDDGSFDYRVAYECSIAKGTPHNVYGDVKTVKPNTNATTEAQSKSASYSTCTAWRYPNAVESYTYTSGSTTVNNTYTAIFGLEKKTTGISHVQTAGTYNVTEKATCLQKGKATYTCSICGDTAVETDVEKLAHDATAVYPGFNKDDRTTYPTAEEVTGVRGDTRAVVMSADGKTATVEPDCVNAGGSYGYCLGLPAGEVAPHWVALSTKKATGHTYVAEVNSGDWKAYKINADGSVTEITDEDAFDFDDENDYTFKTTVTCSTCQAQKEVTYHYADGVDTDADVYNAITVTTEVEGTDCQTTAKTTYTVKDLKYQGGKAVTKTYDIPLTPGAHKYKVTSWNWEDDYEAATITGDCTVEGCNAEEAHPGSDIAAVTQSTGTDGITTFVATYKDQTDTKKAYTLKNAIVTFDASNVKDANLVAGVDQYAAPKEAAPAVTVTINGTVIDSSLYTVKWSTEGVTQKATLSTARKLVATVDWTDEVKESGVEVQNYVAKGSKNAASGKNFEVDAKVYETKNDHTEKIKNDGFTYDPEKSYSVVATAKFDDKEVKDAVIKYAVTDKKVSAYKSEQKKDEWLVQNKIEALDYSLDEVTGLKDAGTYYVYAQISADGFTSYTGLVKTVEISKMTVDVDIDNLTVIEGTDPEFKLRAYIGDDEIEIDPEEYVFQTLGGEDPSALTPGEYKIQMLADNYEFSTEKYNSDYVCILKVVAMDDSTAVDAAKAKAVTDKLNALADDAAEKDVKALRSEYDALTDGAKARVDATALKKLTSAEDKIAADKVIAQLNSASTQAAKAAAYEAYTKLTATQKKLVNAQAAAKVTAAKKAKAAEDAKKAGPKKGKTYKVGGQKYYATSTKAVTLKKAKNAKSVTIPATVKINGKKIAVTGIKKGAFYKKTTTVTVKTKKLTKKSVKKSLKSTKVKTIKVKVGKASANKTYVKKYKKIFTKANAGKKVTVK